MILKGYSHLLLERARYLFGWVLTNPHDGYYIQLVKRDFIKHVRRLEEIDFHLQYLHHDEPVYVGDELLDGPFDIYLG